eukprot:TRINITY_DN649_c0_g1_i6.p1 TRINITY_DN649_c0_g1~~TRINITY_DN649_c0_g1_i6.p1  ORF type:complete len:1694 (+),score=297.78 TRINITY_DN649_c0_g1_i6:796-5877(+)
MLLYPFVKTGQRSIRSYPRGSPFIPNLEVHMEEFNVQFVPSLDKDNVSVPSLLSIGKTVLSVWPAGPSYDLVSNARSQRLIECLVIHMAELSEDSIWRLSMSLDGNYQPVAPASTPASSCTVIMLPSSPNTFAAGPAPPASTIASHTPPRPAVASVPSVSRVGLATSDAKLNWTKKVNADDSVIGFSQYPPDVLAGQITLHMDNLWRTTTLEHISCIGITSLYQIPLIKWSHTLQYWVMSQVLFSEDFVRSVQYAFQMCGKLASLRNFAGACAVYHALHHFAIHRLADISGIFKSLELILYPYLKPTASYLKDYAGGSPFIPNLFLQLSEIHPVLSDGTFPVAKTLSKEDYSNFFPAVAAKYSIPPNEQCLEAFATLQVPPEHMDDANLYAKSLSITKASAVNRNLTPRSEKKAAKQVPSPFTQYSPSQFAKQLSLLQFALWRSVKLSDIFCDEIARFTEIPAIEFADKLKSWAIGQVLYQKKKNLRHAALTFLMDLCSELSSLHNYAGAAAIYSALTHASVSRLTDVWGTLKVNNTAWKKQQLLLYPFMKVGNSMCCYPDDAACVPNLSVHLEAIHGGTYPNKANLPMVATEREKLTDIFYPPKEPVYIFKNDAGCTNYLVSIWTDPTLPTDEDTLWKKSLSIDSTSLPLVRPVGKSEDTKQENSKVKLDYDATPATLCKAIGVVTPLITLDKLLKNVVTGDPLAYSSTTRVTGVHVLLYLYQNLTSAMDWMERLLKIVTTKSNTLSSRMNTLEFISYWADHRWHNFSENYTNLRKWLVSARDSIGDTRLKGVFDVVIEKISKKDNRKGCTSMEESENTDDTSSPRVEDFGLIIFKKSNLNAFATMLTWHHNSLWKAIKVQDLFDYATEPAKAIKDYQMHFNLLSKWATHTILKLEGKKKEAMLKNMIALCSHLISMNNFNAVFIILSGYEKALAQEKLDCKINLRDDVKAQKAELDKLTNPKGDFANYKHAFNDSTGPAIPVLSIHLADMVDLGIKNQGRKIDIINMMALAKIVCMIKDRPEYNLTRGRGYRPTIAMLEKTAMEGAKHQKAGKISRTLHGTSSGKIDAFVASPTADAEDLERSLELDDIMDINSFVIELSQRFSNDSTISSNFFTAYRLALSGTDLMDAIVEQCMVNEEHRQRLLKLINYWVNNYWSDFCEDYEELSEKIKCLDVWLSKNTIKSKYLTEGILASITKHIRAEKGAKTPRVPEIEPVPIHFDDLSATEFAKQLTAYDFAIWSQVTGCNICTYKGSESANPVLLQFSVSDLANQLTLFQDKIWRATTLEDLFNPNVDELPAIVYSRKLQRWASLQVTTSTKPTESVTTLVELCYALLELRNYFGASAIQEALFDPALSGFVTEENLDGKAPRDYEEPCIPNLEIHIQELHGSLPEEGFDPSVSCQEMVQHFFPPSTQYELELNQKCYDMFEKIQTAGSDMIARRTISKVVSFRKSLHEKLSRAGTVQKNPMQKSIEFWNVLAMWTKSTILWESNPKERTKKLKKLLDVCELLYSTFYNFNSLFAIVTALRSSDIWRLKVTWGSLKEGFSKFEKFISPHGNYKQYRELLQGKTSAVPYLGIHKTDVLHLTEGISSKKGQVDVKGIMKAGQVLNELFMTHSEPLGFKENPSVKLWLSELEKEVVPGTEDTQITWNQSLVLEPKKRPCVGDHERQQRLQQRLQLLSHLKEEEIDQT